MYSKQHGSFSLLYALSLLGMFALLIMLLSAHAYMTLREKTRDKLVVAVSYGARVPDPLSAKHQTGIINLIKFGNITGQHSDHSTNWSNPSAVINISKTTLLDQHANTQAALQIELTLPVTFLPVFNKAPIHLTHTEIIHAT